VKLAYGGQTKLGLRGQYEIRLEPNKVRLRCPVRD